MCCAGEVCGHVCPLDARDGEGQVVAAALVFSAQATVHLMPSRVHVAPYGTLYIIRVTCVRFVWHQKCCTLDSLLVTGQCIFLLYLPELTYIL